MSSAGTVSPCVEEAALTGADDRSGTGYVGTRSRSSTAFPWRTNALRVAGVIAGTGLSLLRLPPHVAFDHIWAENGQTFLQQEVDWGTLRSLFTGYQGYAHLVPRLTAAFVSALPMRAWPAALTITACLVTAICALAVYEATVPVIRSRVLRVGLALMVVLVPAAGVESVGSIINVQYVLAFAAMWVAFGQAETRRGCLSAGSFCLMAAGTTPFTGMALLIVGSRWYLERPEGRTRRYQASCAAGLLVGLMYQVVGRLSSGVSRPTAGAALHGYLQALTAVLRGGLLGAGVATDVSMAEVAEAAVIVVCLALVAVRLVQRRSPSSLKVPPLAWFAVSTVAFTVVEYTFRYQGAWGARYVILPSLCVLSALAMAAQAVPRVGLALGLVVLVAALGSFPATSFRDSGPSWAAVLQKAATTCDGQKADSTVTLPIGPSISTIDWHMSLRCGQLRRD